MTPHALADAVAQLTGRYGRLDILFANAGIPGVWAPVADITPDEFDQIMDVNVKGVFLSIQAALPALRQQGGAIVITSSVTGTRMFSDPGASVYATSKAALLTLGKMLAMELARDRIRVNVICPGTVTTSIQAKVIYRNQEALQQYVHYPLGNIPLTDGVFATPEQIASVVLFLGLRPGQPRHRRGNPHRRRRVPPARLSQGSSHRPRPRHRPLVPLGERRRAGRQSAV